MDFPGVSTAVLQGVLPDTVMEFINEHVLPDDAPARILQRQISDAAKGAAASAWPLVEPAANRLVQALYNSPDIVVVLVFLVLLVVFVQVTRWVRRIVMFWVRMTMRGLFWAGVIVLLAVVYQRGLQACIRDAVVISSKVVGFGAGVKDVFFEEYKKYEEQQARARSAAGGTSYGSPRPQAGWR